MCFLFTQAFAASPVGSLPPPVGSLPPLTCGLLAASPVGSLPPHLWAPCLLTEIESWRPVGHSTAASGTWVHTQCLCKSLGIHWKVNPSFFAHKAGRSARGPDWLSGLGWVWGSQVGVESGFQLFLSWGAGLTVTWWVQGSWLAGRSSDGLPPL